MQIEKSVVRLAVGVWLLSSAACVGFHPPPNIRMFSPDVVVEAEDKSFRIAGGEPTKPPFVSKCGTLGDMGGALYYQSSEGLVGKEADALALGARKVRVTIPGEKEPLYGVLMLCNVPKTASGVGARVYSITVPPARAAEAKTNTVVVNESYRWKMGGGGSVMNCNTWVLWLSGKPLW